MRYRSILLGLALIGSVAGCRQKTKPAAVEVTSSRAYDAEQDSNDPQRLIPLHYEQAQGKRVFYEKCVWCHSDATPAGPSNRSNLTPQPPLLNDGNVINPLSDSFIRNVVTLGGSAVGKSPMMPSWGQTLKPGQIQAVVAYVRAMAQPPYLGVK